MKNILMLPFLFLFFINTSKAQIAGTSLQVNNSNYYPITFVDRQGLPFKRGMIDQAVGNPYFINEWKNAKVTSKNGKVFEKVLLKVHLQSNEIHYKNDSNQVIIINQDIVKKIIFDDSTIFEIGFPEINKNNTNTIYKVLSAGKYYLLCHIEKLFIQSKNEMSGEQNNEFKTYTTYYTFINNEIKFFNARKGIKNIDELIQKEDNKIYNKYTTDHTIKTVDDVKLLFDYMNK
jgi:hypothetical protein